MKITGRALAIALLVASAQACSSSSSGVDLLDPATPQYGMTYDQWGVAWWQWIWGQPGTTNPLIDTTGADCAQAQDSSASVFFLAGSSTGTAERTCSFSASQAIFFPIVNGTFDNAGVPAASASTPTQLQMQAQTYLDDTDTSSLALSVDGHALSDLTRGKEGPTQFSYTVPYGDNLYASFGLSGVSGTIDPSFTVGYWAMLPPLSAGSHDISFAGQVTGTSPFHVQVTYHLQLQ
jgi:hypothetical protein